MSLRNQRIGKWGEKLATTYVEKQGYQLVARNARTPYGEIDVVAEKDGIAVFIEVKTSTSNLYGPPEIALTPRKQEHMLATAQHYATEHGIDHWQIEVLTIQGKPGSEIEFTHFENAI